MTKIVHARLNEKGQIMYGLPGDQTGNEVVKQDFYESNWTYIFRPKSEQLALKMVSCAEDIAKNDNIGYGQDDRYSMYEAAKKVNWDFAKITTKCSCDCSQMISSIINASGITVTPYLFTWNMMSYVKPLPEFMTIPYNKGMILKPGDILLKDGHTVIVAEGTEEEPESPSWVGECFGIDFLTVRTAPNDNAGKCEWSTLGTGNLFEVLEESDGWCKIRIAYKYIGYIPRRYVLRKTPYTTGKVTSAVYVRVNAGSGFRQIGVLDSGATVEICDVKPASNGSDWYYVRFGDGWGFSSAKYIKQAK